MYEPQTTVDAGISDNQHPDGAEGCHAADGAGDYHGAQVERSGRISRQGSSDVDRRLSAGLFEPCPPPQCAGVCLHAGGLRRDAGERGEKKSRCGQARAFMKIPTIFTSLAGTQVVQIHRIPCVPDSQERRSAGDTSKVNQQLRAVLFAKTQFRRNT